MAMSDNIKIYCPDHLFDEKSMQDLENDLKESIIGYSVISLIDKESQRDEINTLVSKDSSEELRRITQQLCDDKWFGAPSIDSQDELNKLLESNPIAADLIRTVKNQVRLFSYAEKKIQFRMKPILVVGKPGIGKTYTIEKIAGCLGLASSKIEVASCREAMILCGTARGYTSSTPGEVARQLAPLPMANPIMILDELDKANYDNRFGLSVTAPLLSLLERDTSSAFFDTSLRLNINCSHVSWLATANDLEVIPEAIRSRFRIIYFNEPTVDDMKKIIASVSRKVLLDEGFTDVWVDATQDFMANCSQVSGRDMTHIISASLGRQIELMTETRTIVLEMEDLKPFLSPQGKKRGIGFIQ